MNEIIGPIYYVLSSDPDLEWSKYAEHDTFYCFTRVMSEIRDNFIQSMDESTSGIHANMSKGILFCQFWLCTVDSPIWLHYFFSIFGKM